MDARTLALKAHKGQMYGKLPYSYHLGMVSSLLTGYGQVVQDIAWLHDTVEDTSLTLEAIEEVCGPVVARCVDLLTDPPGANRRERKAAAYARLAAVDVANVDEAWALLVKAADRLANVQFCVRERSSLVEMYRKEHEAFRKAVLRPGWNDALVEATDALLGVPNG
jgi:(p)ppGpp synthase/HD superfamily hydrolase